MQKYMFWHTYIVFITYILESIIMKSTHQIYTKYLPLYKIIKVLKFIN